MMNFISSQMSKGAAWVRLRRVRVTTQLLQVALIQRLWICTDSGTNKFILGPCPSWKRSKMCGVLWEDQGNLCSVVS